ncbi:hypothetical protein FSARC_7531 [Fusarium sarcochroum]|uniref:ARCA protein n=1 Tax=Fusarium sarcochroum TaxID=1208366 RepID=A0A8H4TV33_9HYPO|nr:hypothetical protein FSARC_7531 [Fusarium sarcochroum]
MGRSHAKTPTDLSAERSLLENIGNDLPESNDTTTQSPVDSNTLNPVSDSNNDPHFSTLNPLSINELLCNDADSILPHEDQSTSPIAVTQQPAGSLYVDTSIGPFIDQRGAELLLYFKKVIARPWFEVTDSHFTDEAFRAPICPLLLYSLLAVSSSHKSRFLEDQAVAQEYARYGEDYHEKCISLLLPMLNDGNTITDGAFLACSTILRWYEELSAPIHGKDDASHLLGGYASVAESFKQDLPWAGFRQAALWIHLRQDIFNAAINQTVPRTDVDRLGIDRSTSPADETIWAKRVVCLEAEVVSYCFGNEASSAQKHSVINSKLEDWDRYKPETFIPVFYQDRAPSQGRMFPVVSLLIDACVFGLTHYYFCMLMMLVHDPRTPKVGAQYLESQKRTKEKILYYLRMLCGLACSSPVPPGRGVTCLAISLFGAWITNRAEQDAVIGVLEKVDLEDAWTTSRMQQDLKAQWNDND